MLGERSSLLAITVMLTAVLLLREIRMSVEYQGPAHAFVTDPSPQKPPAEETKRTELDAPSSSSSSSSSRGKAQTPTQLPPILTSMTASTTSAALNNGIKAVPPKLDPIVDKKNEIKQPPPRQLPIMGSSIQSFPAAGLASVAPTAPLFPRKEAVKPPTPLAFAGTYMCRDVAESYGAAFIVHKSKFMKTGFGGVWTEPFALADMKSPGWNIKQNVTFKSINMEGASHIVLKATKGALKTIDGFDFYVEHLSIYERRLGLLHLPDKFKKPTQAAVIQVMQKREEALKATWAMGVDGGGAALGDKVLCAMPFYGVAVGTGHSVAETRFFYLNSTFWSVTKLFRNVVVFVTAMSDKRFLLEQSNLPFYDVVLINDLPKPKYLGVAGIIEMQRRFQTGEWSKKFDYIYYTESDQVLHLRPSSLPEILAKATSRDLITPHRFLPFPHPDDYPPGKFEQMKEFNQGLRHELTHIQTKRVVDVEDEVSEMRCCFDLGNCRNRDQWLSWKGDPRVHFIRSQGSNALLNGEGNLFKMQFRVCALQKGGNCQQQR